MTDKIKPDPNCPLCKGEGEYYLNLPDGVGSPNLVRCSCVEPKPERKVKH